MDQKFSQGSWDRTFMSVDIDTLLRGWVGPFFTGLFSKIVFIISIILLGIETVQFELFFRSSQKRNIFFCNNLQFYIRISLIRN